MRTILCKRCGKVIEVKGQAVYCDDCRKAIRFENAVKERTCKDCGAIFLGGPRAMYCPECRIVRRKKADLECKKRKQNGTTREIGGTDFCQKCGNPYIINGPLQKYCPDCKKIMDREIRNRQSLEWSRNNKENLKNKKNERAKVEKICVV